MICLGEEALHLLEWLLFFFGSVFGFYLGWMGAKHKKTK